MPTRTILPLLLACLAPAAAAAQTAYLEDSGIIGQGKTLTISRLPTADANGKFHYFDGTFSLTVNAAGVPTLTSAPFKASPNLATNHFVAGRYYVKSGNAATQFGTLTDGPGSGGSTVWSLIMDQNPDGNFPDQSTWQTGNPAPDVAARLAAAKVVLNPNFSYGYTIIGVGGTFPSNGLLGAEQVNTNLTLFSYSYINEGGGFSDSAEAVASITLVHCMDASCSNAPP